MEETSGYAHSESDYGGEKTSTGKSEQEIRVVSPQDFIDMDDGEAVCFIGKKSNRFGSNPWTHGGTRCLRSVSD
jgi:hypothetical protein